MAYPLLISMAGSLLIQFQLESRGSIMFKVHLHPYCKMSWRDKARLNICIAKDLADSFGGRKAEYLKRLNQRLRIRIAFDTIQPFAKAA
jgi:hypothetical protein